MICAVVYLKFATDGVRQIIYDTVVLLKAVDVAWIQSPHVQAEQLWQYSGLSRQAVLVIDNEQILIR